MGKGSRRRLLPSPSPNQVGEVLEEMLKVGMLSGDAGSLRPPDALAFSSASTSSLPPPLTPRPSRRRRRRGRPLRQGRGSVAAASSPGRPRIEETESILPILALRRHLRSACSLMGTRSAGLTRGMLVFLIGDDPEKKPYTRASRALLFVSMVLISIIPVLIVASSGCEWIQSLT